MSQLRGLSVSPVSVTLISSQNVRENYVWATWDLLIRWKSWWVFWFGLFVCFFSISNYYPLVSKSLSETWALLLLSS